MEVGEYFAIKSRSAGPGGITFDERAEYIAMKLRLRVQKTDPITITRDWLMEQVGVPGLDLVEYVLIYAEMPQPKDAGGEAKKD